MAPCDTVIAAHCLGMAMPVEVARVPGRSSQGPSLGKGMLWEVPEGGREAQRSKSGGEQ